MKVNCYRKASAMVGRKLPQYLLDRGITADRFEIVDNRLGPLQRSYFLQFSGTKFRLGGGATANDMDIFDGLRMQSREDVRSYI